MAIGAIGTDTGGSVRIPASMCGVLGLKPTFGRVSTYGTVPLSVSFDHVGPLAKSSWDGAAILEVISGPIRLIQGHTGSPISLRCSSQ